MPKIIKAKPYKEYKAQVLQVIDGDTIEVLIDMGFGVSYKDKLRLLDFDAPETFRPSCKEEKLLGVKCKNFLISLIQNETIILRTFKKSTEKYGRILAQVFLKGVDIIEEMKKQGFEKKLEGYTTSIRTVAKVNKTDF